MSNHLHHLALHSLSLSGGLVLTLPSLINTVCQSPITLMEGDSAGWVGGEGGGL